MTCAARHEPEIANRDAATRFQRIVDGDGVPIESP
jgi:hypothetical protein